MVNHPYEVKNAAGSFQDVDLKERIIVGYAAHFDNIDRHSDRIAQKAFNRTLKQGPDSVALWHHDVTMPVGPWAEPPRPDEKGLLTHTRVSKTRINDDNLTLVQDGAIGGMSIGFSTIKSEFDEEAEVRTITEIRLYEYSFVTIPANPQAGITGLKSFATVNDVCKQMQKFEHALRHSVFVTDEVPKMLELAVRQWRGAIEALADAPTVQPPDSGEKSTPVVDSGEEPTPPEGLSEFASAIVKKAGAAFLDLQLAEQIQRISVNIGKEPTA